MENKVPKEAAAQGAREGPKAKVPASPEGVASKMEPVPLARKAEAPKGLRRPGIPTKSSSSRPNRPSPMTSQSPWDLRR